MHDLIDREGRVVLGIESTFLTFVIHLSKASSDPLAFNAGKEPTTPLLHCATHKSGLLTMKSGARECGKSESARSWAATVFIAIFVAVSASALLCA